MLSLFLHKGRLPAQQMFISKFKGFLLLMIKYYGKQRFANRSFIP